MEEIEVKIKRSKNAKDLPLPAYHSLNASGMDLLAAVEGEVVLQPRDIRLIPTGIHISLPVGFEAQIRPRSGLASRHGVTVVNAPGTVDADYRGEVFVILGNFGKDPFAVRRGMRIAQMVIQPVVKARLVEASELDNTMRGTGGFGHTGTDTPSTRE